MQVLQQKPFFNDTELPTGFLFSPLAAPLSSAAHDSTALPQCPHCGGYANCFTEYTFSSSSWRCDFCGTVNTSSVPLRSDASHVHHLDVDHLPSADPAYLSADRSWPSTVILVIDATLDSDLLTEVITASKNLLQTLPPTINLTIIACSSSVTIFDLAASTPVDAPDPQPATVPTYVLPGATQPTVPMLKHLLSISAGLFAPISACIMHACTALDSLRPYHSMLPQRARPRCIGSAIECMLLLHRLRHTTGRTPGTSRAVVLLGGPCTVGPGTVPLAVLDGAGSAADEFARMEAEKYVQEIASALVGAGTHSSHFWCHSR
jgi:hypothetical protein